MRLLKGSGLSVALLVLAAPRARADEASLPGPEPPPRLSFSVTAGGAPTPLHVFGGVDQSGRRTGLLLLQVHRTLVQSDDHVFEAVFALVPVELEAGTPLVITPSVTQPQRNATVYGGGVDPLGLSMRFGKGPWRPFWNASGGLRWFLDRVPVPRAQRFNFAADVGFGLYHTLSPHYAMSIGLDLHHISNANLAEKNPGVNFLMLTLGFWPTH